MLGHALRKVAGGKAALGKAVAARERDIHRLRRHHAAQVGRWAATDGAEPARSLIEDERTTMSLAHGFGAPHRTRIVEKPIPRDS
jgi:hypothetical protein